MLSLPGSRNNFSSNRTTEVTSSPSTRPAGMSSSQVVRIREAQNAEQCLKAVVETPWSSSFALNDNFPKGPSTNIMCTLVFHVVMAVGVYFSFLYLGAFGLHLQSLQFGGEVWHGASRVHRGLQRCSAATWLDGLTSCPSLELWNVFENCPHQYGAKIRGLCIVWR